MTASITADSRSSMVMASSTCDFWMLGGTVLGPIPVPALDRFTADAVGFGGEIEGDDDDASRGGGGVVGDVTWLLSLLLPAVRSDGECESESGVWFSAAAAAAENDFCRSRDSLTR
jgi:hypothetical protein